MLVLSRKVNQTIVINDHIRITFLAHQGRVVRLGIEAPREITVIRDELRDDSDLSQTSRRP